MGYYLITYSFKNSSLHLALAGSFCIDFLHFTKKIMKNQNISKKFGTVMQNEFSMHLQCKKKLNFKNPRWQTTNTLERPILHHHDIVYLSIFKMVAVCHPRFF